MLKEAVEDCSNTVKNKTPLLKFFYKVLTNKCIKVDIYMNISSISHCIDDLSPLKSYCNIRPKVKDLS